MKRCTTVSNGNNHSAGPHALKPNKEMKKVRLRRHLHSLSRLPLVTVDYRSVTFVVMSVVIMGDRGMIFFLPTDTQWQACPVLMAAVAFAARRIGFFFPTRIKEENGR